MITDNDNEEYRKRMIEFLERTDRFAAPDQLPYLKPMDVIRRFSPNFEKTKLNNNRKQVFNFPPNKEIRSLSNSKCEYCEHWLTEQNQMTKNFVGHFHIHLITFSY